MPASGKKEVMSEAELQQRSIAGQANTTHGAYSFEARGEAALEKPARSRMQELREQVRDRSGVLDLIQENAAKAVMMVELVTSFVANQKMSGVPLDEIPALRILPSFMNSAQRALKDLISLMPSNEGAIDVDKVLEAVRHGQEES